MKPHVMIIDDDASLRKLLQTALMSKGYDVTALSDPTEFPHIHSGDCPCPADRPCADILIADLIMPNIQGLDFLKKLKAAGCKPLERGNVAIMSGYLTIHYLNELNQMGIHYFRKPFELKEVYAWIEQCRTRISA